MKSARLGLRKGRSASARSSTGPRAAGEGAVLLALLLLAALLLALALLAALAALLGLGRRASAGRRSSCRWCLRASRERNSVPLAQRALWKHCSAGVRVRL